jgi:hypothetical protein
MADVVLAERLLDRADRPRPRVDDLARRRCAATTPAPIFISPCVRVGPSSTTSTRLPRSDTPSSTLTALFACTTVAPGFTRAIVSSSCAT